MLKGFWSPEGKPTKPEAKCFAPILTWYLSWTNIIQKSIILEWNQFERAFGEREGLW